jgi:allene oxide cyclase
MRRNWAILVAAALIAATAISVSIVSVSAAGSKVTRMVVVERATTDEVIDLKAEGDSNGDLLVFHNELYDADNQTVVGSDQGDCIRIEAGVSWECRWVSRFDEGSITVEGPFYDAGPSVLAITGGTGAYRGARGSMRLVARDDAGTEYTFIFRIVKD